MVFIKSKRSIGRRRSQRPRRHSPPLPISLPAMGVLLQAGLLWYLAFWYIMDYPMLPYSWANGTAAGFAHAWAVCIQAFKYASIGWVIFMVVHIATEWRSTLANRRPRLWTDLFALLIALWMVYGSFVWERGNPDPGGYPPRQGMHEFQYDPASQKWWYQP